MSSLREIKDRIGSIRSTLKITGAMKLVASVKFRKAERALKALRPYESTLISIFRDTLSAARTTVDSFASAQIPADDKNPQKKVAVVALASNSSLCGSFNSNILRKVEAVLEHLNGNADIFAIGRKIADSLRKSGFPSPAVPIFASDPSYASLTSGTDLSAKSSTASGSVFDSSSHAARPASPSSLPKFTIGSSSINARSASPSSSSSSSSATPPSFLDLNDLVTHPTYEAATHLATALIEAYNSGKYAGVVLIYNRFISSSKHEVVLERYLPFEAEGPAVLGKSSASSAPPSSSPSPSSSSAHSSSAPSSSCRR